LISNFKRFVVVLFLFWSTFSLIGCATTASKNFNSRITKSQKELRYSGRPFLGDEKPVTDLSAQGQIQAILDRIIYASPLRGYRIPVFFVDGQNPAFTDGKSVYVNAAFAQVFWQDQSLIALVMAHEFGHILANHDPASGKEIAMMYSAAAPLMSLVPFGAYANLAVREGLTMGRHAYSRVQEKEADAIAIFLGTQAGYDPYGLIRFFDYIEKARKGQLGSLTLPITNYANPSAVVTSVAVSVLRSTDLYKTHPSIKQRIKDLELMIQQKNVTKLNADSKGSNQAIAEIYRALEARRPK
jgi:predicted Zn-dependent protease